MKLVNHDWPVIVTVAWIVFLMSVFIALCIGWVLNLVALAGMSIPPFSGLLVLRIIGIFIPPIGGVIGYVGP